MSFGNNRTWGRFDIAFHEFVCTLRQVDQTDLNQRTTIMMNAESDKSSRSRLDLILFGEIFVSFVAAVTGLVTNSAGVAVTGLILMLMGLACFALKQE